MPFINGRYYVNPVMGQALEAAREAEAALADLENRARQNSGASSNGDGGDDGSGDRSYGGSVSAHGKADGPIHRVEIEAAELVPAHSGRAGRGYVARVHRQHPADARGGHSNGFAEERRAGVPHGASHEETHVFADHRDLLSFLRDELAQDSNAGSPRRHSV